MKYRVWSRDDWDAELAARFGKPNDVHDLTGDEVVEAIIQLGRADINKIVGQSHDGAECTIEFQNGYD